MTALLFLTLSLKYFFQSFSCCHSIVIAVFLALWISTITFAVKKKYFTILHYHPI